MIELIRRIRRFTREFDRRDVVQEWSGEPAHRPGRRASSRRTFMGRTADPLTCSDAVIYGVRGAFEPFHDNFGGAGSAVFGVAERATSLLESDGSSPLVELVGVACPANPWLYHWSRWRGARNLARLLAEDRAQRPDQISVLVGLSQGAEIVRRAAAILPEDIAKTITAVVLLGDPTRHPDDPWSHGTSDPHPGIAARYAVPIPEVISGATWAYALDGDEIAVNDTGLRGLFQSGTHTLYERNHERVQDQAASFISERLRSVGP